MRNPIEIFLIIIMVRAVRKSTADANYGSSDCILPKRYND